MQNVKCIMRNGRTDTLDSHVRCSHLTEGRMQNGRTDTLVCLFEIMKIKIEDK